MYDLAPHLMAAGRPDALADVVAAYGLIDMRPIDQTMLAQQVSLAGMTGDIAPAVRRADQMDPDTLQMLFNALRLRHRTALGIGADTAPIADDLAEFLEAIETDDLLPVATRRLMASSPEGYAGMAGPLLTAASTLPPARRQALLEPLTSIALGPDLR